MVDVKVKTADGKVIRVRDFSPVDTKRGAEEHERQVRAAILNGTWGREDKSSMKLRDLWPEWIGRPTKRGVKKAATISGREVIWRCHLEPKFGDTAISKIDRPALDRFQAELLAVPFKPSTVKGILVQLKGALGLAEDYGYIERAPKLEIVSPKDPTKIERELFLSFEETDQLLRFLEASDLGDWKPLIITALKTGLRLGELRALRWSDIDFQSGELTVRRSIWKEIEDLPKSGIIRILPLGPLALAALKAHRHLKGPYVFCNEEGERLTVHQLAKAQIMRLLKRAGISKPLGLHGLRHTFASHLVMRAYPISVVSRLMGHADIQTTMIYAHLTPDICRDAMAGLDAPAPTYKPLEAAVTSDASSRSAEGAHLGHTEQSSIPEGAAKPAEVVSISVQ